MTYKKPEIIKFDDTITITSSVVIFGNFDGVHLGHQSLIDELIKYGHKKTKVLITFHPHTQSIVKNSNSLKLITPYREKLKLLSTFNIDYISIINFNSSFSKLSPDQFIDSIINKYNPQTIIIGYDNNFGFKGKGNYIFLKKYLIDKNIELYQNKPFSLNNSIIKSSLIKELIKNGDIKSANSYLGRKFKLSGNITNGNKIGKKIGFPTANLKIEDKQQIIPKVGVYSVNLIVGTKKYKALCNIGYRPTFFERGKLSIESYIVNHNDLDLYNTYISLEFNFFIREEIKFNNKEGLVKQIKKDIEALNC